MAESRRPVSLLACVALSLACVALSLARAAPARADSSAGELLINGDFQTLRDHRPEGWSPVGGRAPALDGGQPQALLSAVPGMVAVTVPGPDRTLVRSWAQRITGWHPGQRLVLSGSLAASGAVAANVIVQCFAGMREVERFALREEGDLSGSSGWRRYRRDLTVPRSTEIMMIRAALYGEGSARFAQLSLVPEAEAARAPWAEAIPKATSVRAERDEGAATLRLVRVEGAYVVRPLRVGTARAATAPERASQPAAAAIEPDAWVRLAVPPSIRDQVPLSLAVACEPPGSLLRWRVIDEQGNASLQVDLNAAVADSFVFVRWDARVLLASGAAIQPEEPALDDAGDRFAHPSPSIQSDAPELLAAARGLAPPGTPAFTVARAAETFARATLDLEPGGAQDALATLRRGGAVCTGRANLLAALLRARGVPARLLSSVPVDARTQEHFLVEARLDGRRFTRLETTGRGLSATPWDPSIDVALRVILDGDEGELGVPHHWRSGPALECWPMGAAFGDGCYHRSETMTVVSATPVHAAELVRAARRAWRAQRGRSMSASQTWTAPLPYGEPFAELGAALAGGGGGTGRGTSGGRSTSSSSENSMR